MGGLGRVMPVMLGCYTLVSLALIGIPPSSGFVSKWYLASGALASGTGVWDGAGPAVLLVSALLTAGYLLPLAIQGFLPGPDRSGNIRPLILTKGSWRRPGSPGRPGALRLDDGPGRDLTAGNPGLWLLSGAAGSGFDSASPRTVLYDGGAL